MKSNIYLIVTIYSILLTVSSASGYQLTFTPRISIGGEYTDNLFLSNDNEDEEFITTISPGFTSEVSGATSGAEISYDPSYVFYDRYDEYNTWRHSVQLSGWTNISNITELRLNDSFVSTEEPISEEDTTIRRSRETYYRNSTSLNLTHQIGESDLLSLGYVYSILENDDPDIEDSASHIPSIGLNYWFTPHMGIEINVSYTMGEFDTSDDFDHWNGSLRLIRQFTRDFQGFIQYAHTDMNFKGDSEDYQVLDPSIGINYTIAEDTTLSLSVGYFFQDMDNSEDESGISVTGDLGKTWRIRRGSVSLTGSSGYDESYFDAENLGFDIFYQAQCMASYGFTRHISSDISGSYREDKYVNLETERKDRTTMAGMGLNFQPQRWFSIGLDYSYRMINSTLDENDYDENRIMIRFTLIPSLPFRLK